MNFVIMFTLQLTQSLPLPISPANAKSTSHLFRMQFRNDFTGITLSGLTI